MANIRKSFNFKNGVQVDNDKFIVNPNGLVGIGTTIPRELLDVRGTTKVSGLLTATDVHSTDAIISGVATISNFTDGVLQISSGIVTAVTGVVTFYGDGQGLINIPSSQWVDIDVGLGFTSIYAQGNVGVGTNDPRFSFQIGGQPGVSGHEGVGVNSTTGDVISTGIITATTFSGDVESVNATIGNATITNGIEAANANVTGVATVTNLLELRSTDGTPGRVDYYCESSNAHRTRVQSAPHSEYSGDVVVTLPTTNGDLIAGDTPSAITQNINTSGKITATELDSTRLDVSGIGTVNDLLATTSAKVGTGTATFTALSTGFVGVGTENPKADFEVIKPGDTDIELTSRTGTARFTIGNLQNSNGQIRYGLQADTLDILNFSTGNIRSILDAGTVGLNTGSFSWHHQSPTSSLMTLTYEGNLGINDSNPIERLTVGGGITATGNGFFGGNVEAQSFSGNGQNLTNIVIPDPVVSNTFRQTGISTFGEIHVFNNTGVGNPLTVGLSSIGISTQSAIAGLDARRDIGLFSRLAINSDSINGIQMPRQAFEIVFGDIRLEVDGSIKTSAIGIGASARSAIDMNGAVGLGLSYAPLILSSVTNAQRGNIVNRVDGGAVVTGSLIYNSTSNQFQGWNGSSWLQLSSAGSAGISAVVDDTTPQLGGPLDLNSNNITGTGNLDYTGSFNVSGLSTFASDIDLNASIDIDGHTELDDVNVSSAATISTLQVGSNGAAAAPAGQLAILAGNTDQATLTLGQNVDGTGQNHLGFYYNGPSNNAAQIFTSNGNMRFVVDGGGGGAVPLNQQAGFQFGFNGNFANPATVEINAIDVAAGVRTEFLVRGNARVTGIMTVGTDSVIIDGNRNEIHLGTGVTLTSSGAAEYSGIITAQGFVGDGSQLTGISGSGGVTVQDEGSALSTTATTLNFVGSGVTASGTGATKTITISGGGGGGSMNELVDDETPQLGGDLDLNDREVSGIGTVSATRIVTSRWVLGATGSSHYTFTGPGNLNATEDPTIYLVRGQSYRFFNNSGGHPFRIQTTINGSAGTQYNTGVINQDAGNGQTLEFNVPMDAPDTLYYQCTAHPLMGGKIIIMAPSARFTRSVTTTSLGADASGNFTVPGCCKTYSLLKIETDHPAWIRLYTDQTSRANDSARTFTTDPTPGSGVIAEARSLSAGASTFRMTPAVVGWNDESTPDDNVYIAVTNNDTVSRSITVTLTIVRMED